MATWVRNGTGTAPSATDADLTGTYELDNATAPGDFDVDAVNSVRFQYRVEIVSGTFASPEDHTVLRTVDLTLNGVGTAIAEIGGSNVDLDNGSDPIDTDLTDSSVTQGLTIGQWEGAELNPTDVAAVRNWTNYNQNMSKDGVNIQVTNVVVTIDYTPAAAEKFIDPDLAQSLTVAFDPIDLLRGEVFITPDLAQSLAVAFDPNVAWDQAFTPDLAQSLAVAFDPVVVNALITGTTELNIAGGVGDTSSMASVSLRVRHAISAADSDVTLFWELLQGGSSIETGQVGLATGIGETSVDLSSSTQITNFNDLRVKFHAVDNSPAATVAARVYDVWLTYPSGVGGGEQFITPTLTQQLTVAFDPIDLLRGEVFLSPDLAQSLAVAFDPIDLVRGEVFLSPDLAQQLAVAFDPTDLVRGEVFLSPGLAQSLAAAFDPVVIGPEQFFTPPLAQSLATAFDPTDLLRGEVFLTPDLATQLTVAFDPVLGIEQFFTPELATSLAVAFDPIDLLRGEVFLSPELAQSLAVGFTPIVSLDTEQSITPGLAQSLATAFDPAVLLEQFITPDLATSLATGFDPAVGEQFVTPALAQQLAVGFDPVVNVIQTLSPDLAQSLATAFDPAVFLEQFIALSLVQSLARVPTVLDDDEAHQAAGIGTWVAEDFLTIARVADVTDPRAKSDWAIEATITSSSPGPDFNHGSHTVMADNFPLAAGESVIFGFWHKFITRTDSGAAVAPFVRWYDSDGGLISTTASTFTITTAGYTYIEKEIGPAPAGTAFGRLKVGYDDSTSGDVFRARDFYAASSGPRTGLETFFTPDLAQSLATAFDPVVVAQQFVSPDLAQSLAAGFDPALGLTLTPDLAQQLAVAFDPTVALAAQLITPDLAQSLATAFDPVVIAQQFITPELAQSLVTPFDPVVLAGQILEPDLATQLTVAFGPTLNLNVHPERAIPRISDVFWTADNSGELFINGVMIGIASPNWPVVTQVAHDLKKGDVIGIHATDAGGVGAAIVDFLNPVRIQTSTAWKVIATTPPADWSEQGFDDSAWAFASSQGAWGVAPWFTTATPFPADSTAEWIWSDEPETDNEVWLRYVVVESPTAFVVFDPTFIMGPTFVTPELAQSLALGRDPSVFIPTGQTLRPPLFADVDNPNRITATLADTGRAGAEVADDGRTRVQIADGAHVLVRRE